MSDLDDGLYYDNDEFDEYDDEDASRDFDHQLNECGYDPDFPGRCWDIGTEHCSFFCPLHASIFSEDIPDIPF